MILLRKYLAKEILSDPKFIQQKGIRSLVDGDARVGYKSKTKFAPEPLINHPDGIDRFVPWSKELTANCYKF